MGDGATSEVRILRSDGRLTHIVRSADPQRRITAEEIERVLREAPPAYRNQWRPETYPTYRDFQVAPDGRLWIQEFSPELADPESWAAFDVDGRLLGRLEVPRKIRGSNVWVAGFGVNELLMREFDGDGFEHLVFYPIVPVRP
jgi:hypothetical protein